MKAGTKFQIEIGETKIVDAPNSKHEISVTTFWLNGEERQATISPAGFATDENIMNLIGRFCVEYLNQNKDE